MRHAAAKNCGIEYKELLSSLCIFRSTQSVIKNYRGEHHSHYEANHTCYTRPLVEYLFFEESDLFLNLIQNTLKCSLEFQKAFIEKLNDTDMKGIADFIHKETGDKIKDGIKSLKEYGTRLKEKKVVERGQSAVDLSTMLQKNAEQFIVPERVESKEPSCKTKLECLVAKLQFAKDLHSKDPQFVAHRGYKCIIANIASLLFTVGIPNLVKRYRTGKWLLFDKTTTQELIGDLDVSVKSTPSLSIINVCHAHFSLKIK